MIREIARAGVEAFVIAAVVAAITLLAIAAAPVPLPV